MYNDVYYQYRYATELGGMTTDQRKSHWLNFGIDEGRCASPIFDANYYRDNNPDLASFGNDYHGLINHYVNFGISEGRYASIVFDPVYYADNNPDIKSAFGTNYKLIINHFLENGIGECREKCSQYFNLKAFKLNYKDLQDAYHDNNLRNCSVHPLLNQCKSRAIA